MAGIVLKTCPKTYIKETHRSRSPDETLTFIEGMKQTLGMRSFSEVTHLDRLGIHVFTCYRVRPDSSRTDHTGKGLSSIQAQVSLTMESAERYSSEYKEEYRGGLIKGDFDTLEKRYNILNPEELILPRFGGYTHGTEIHWVRGCELVSKTEILLPACSVFHPFHLDDPPLLSTHTNGIASGNAMEEAVCHALAEVIERDAWSINQFTGEARDALFIEDRKEYQFIIDIIEKFLHAQIEVVAKDITSDVGVPVIAAFSHDPLYENLMTIDGFGAHLDPKVAMVRALLELATTRGLFIQKHGIESFRKNYFDDVEPHKDESDYRFCAYRQKSLGELGASYSDDLMTDITIMMDKLTAKGFTKIIAVDLTRPEIGIPTVRVVVPGMEVFCFDKTRMGERIFSFL